MRICCERMRAQLERGCPRHDDPYLCPDRLVVHSAEFGVWGLVVRGEGRMAVPIAFCPWCGTRLAGLGEAARSSVGKDPA